MTGVVELDARAVAESVRVAGAVKPGQWELPTPCPDWNLGELLAHMAGQHAGFAAALRGEDAGLAAFAPLPLGDDPAASYAATADAALAAFAAPGVLERTVLLPEIHPTLRFPARTAIGFHLLDYVVHAWDVAVSIGTPVDLDPEILSAALSVAEQVPQGVSRTAPGAAFGPVLPTPDGASVLDRVLTLSGRTPSWRA